MHSKFLWGIYETWDIISRCVKPHRVKYRGVQMTIDIVEDQVDSKIRRTFNRIAEEHILLDYSSGIRIANPETFVMNLLLKRNL